MPRPRGHPKSTMRLGSPRCPTSNTANSTASTFHDFQGSLSILSILSTNNLEVDSPHWQISAEKSASACQRNGTMRSALTRLSHADGTSRFAMHCAAPKASSEGLGQGISGKVSILDNLLIFLDNFR